MKQMYAPQVKALGRAKAGQLNHCFVRDERGMIFFLQLIRGCPIRHIVFEDGSVMRKTGDFLSPHEGVTLINHEDCGITGFKFAPDGASLTA